MKKYLMSGVAAIAFLAAFTSCSKSTDLYDQGAVDQKKTEEKTTDFKTSFENKVGKINPNQDWNLFANFAASITVKAGFSDEYTVGLYENNPLFNKDASCYAKTKVKEGATAELKFTAGKGLTSVYVGVYDAKGHGVAQSVTVNSGKIEAIIGNSNAATRAAESDYPAYARSMGDFLQWTISEMQGWTALTNEALTDPTNGNHTLNDKQYIGSDWHWIGNGDGHHYRIPAGTTVTEAWSVGDSGGNTLDNVVVYVEGKVIITSENTLNAVTLVVGNGGEIEFQGENRMSTSGRFVVAAGGKITGTDGALFGVENGAPCYNAGTIEFNGTLRVNGSEFYNNGTINVDILEGTTKGTNVTNFGNITARTNYIAADAYNAIYTNACHMTYTENAGFGQLTLLNNSRLDVGGELLITGENYLYNLSEINAGSIKWNNGKVTGPTASGEFAVIKATKFLVDHANTLNTYNNIYYDVDPSEFYNYQGVKDDISNNWGNAHHIQGGKTSDESYGVCWCNAPIQLWSNEANATISIPAGECTGTGYNSDGNDGGDIPDGLVYYSIAFEDLGSTDDFDFNDIVLYVGYNDETKKATVTCVAEGGILEVDVKYNGATLFSHTDGQMHTNKGSYGTAEVDMTNPATDCRNFSITVKDGESSAIVSSATVTGQAPQALIIPGQWAWPTERTSITEAYTRFATWAGEMTEDAWYTDPTEGKVVR